MRSGRLCRVVCEVWSAPLSHRISTASSDTGRAVFTASSASHSSCAAGPPAGVAIPDLGRVRTPTPDFQKRTLVFVLPLDVCVFPQAVQCAPNVIFIPTVIMCPVASHLTCYLINNFITFGRHIFPVINASCIQVTRIPRYNSSKNALSGFL